MSEKTKKIFSATLKIAVPIALQSVVAFMVNMADTVMLGQLGDIELSASALANQIFFIISLATAGIADGANVLISQAFGKGDMKKADAVLSYTYKLALAVILLFSAAAILFPSAVMAVFTTDRAVIAAGEVYLRIVAVSYLFYGITTVSTGVLRAVHDVRIAFFGSGISMLVNVVLNWGLIFGQLGLPKLGIAGAAIATVIARIVECVVVVIYVYTKEETLNIRLSKLLISDKAIRKIYFKTGMPIVANELFWAVGESVIAIILGRIGTEVVAANSIAAVFNQLSSVFITGATAATCVIIGNTIGSGKIEELAFLKKFYQRFALCLGVASGVLMLAVCFPVVGLYQVTATARQYAIQLVILTAVIQPIQAFQITNMMGILRGGGDVRFAMWNDMISLWCVTIPLGFFTGIVLKLPIALVFCFLRLEKPLKGLTSELRLRKGKWVHNMVSQQESDTER